jgi:hypothetical protein
VPSSTFRALTSGPWKNGKINDFNWYVNANVVLEQICIQPDFTSAVKAQPDRHRVPLHKRFLYAHVTSCRFQPALQSVGLLRAGRHVRHPMEGLPHQHFADLHDRLNIGIVRRVPLELGGVWSKSGCEHLSGVEGGVHHSHEGRGRPRVLPPIPRDTRMVFIAAPIRL